MAPSRHVIVYTDGGAEPNPGLGGWGAVILDPDGGAGRELAGGETVTTNNRMELTAAIEALRALEPGHEVDVYTDSSYLRLGITRWLLKWKRAAWRLGDGKPVKNDDLWRALEEASARHRVRWHWVRGHSGHQHNERAHALAAAEIRRRRETLRASAAPEGGAGDSRARDGRGSTLEPEPRAPDAVVLLKLSCVGGRGAWAAQLRQGAAERVVGGEASGVTSNRLELLAAAELLDLLPRDGLVEWRGGSDYFRDGAAKWLDGWRRRGYRTSAGEPVKNADLWRRLEQPLAGRTLRFRAAAEDDAAALRDLERDVKRRLGRS